MSKILLPPDCVGTMLGAVIGYDDPAARDAMRRRLHILGYVTTAFRDTRAPFAIFVVRRRGA